MRYDQIYDRIETLCNEKGWSLFKLSKESKASYSTLYNTMKNHTVPQIDLIQKVCDGFNISISEFFQDEDNEKMQLSDKDMLLINNARELNTNERDRVLAYMQGLLDMKNKD